MAGSAAVPVLGVLCALLGVRPTDARGCFAPWVPVRMADGSRRSIAEVKSGEQVLSWNSATAQPFNATVVSTDFVAVAGRTLYHIQVGSNQSAASGLRRLSSATTLVVTEDHPIWSPRVGGLVSAAPDLALSSYGLASEPMQRFETFIDHNGEQVPGMVSRWGSTLQQVVTLELEGHHWFYADDVRVHNKGFGGHSSFHSRGRSSFHHTSQMRYAHYSYHSGRRWTAGRGTWGLAVIVAASERRRRGTWNDMHGGTCAMDAAYVEESVAMAKAGVVRRLTSEGSNPADQPNASNAALNFSRGNSTAIKHLCATIMNSTLAGHCTQCQECTTPACVKSKPGCQKFLSTLYKECDSGRDNRNDGGGMVLYYLGLAVIAAMLAALFICPSSPSAPPQSAAPQQSNPRQSKPAE